MQLVLIRHGQTAANQARRYAGSTDQPLCPAGEEALCALVAQGIYPPVQRLYVSPMRRCMQTAALVYPGVPSKQVDGLREQDFGRFEGHTYAELCDQPAYRAWIASAGESGIPGGESKAAFVSRCRLAFADVLADAEENGLSSLAVVAHGGSWMAVLSACAVPARDYYSWQVPNGCGWLVETDGTDKLSVQKAIGFEPTCSLGTV